MHTEYYEVSKEAEEIINRGKREGKKIIAVGTTSVRTLETVADENGFVQAGRGNRNIFIYQGYIIKCGDKIITNFHLPESTLIMLVSAFLGRDKTLKAYNYAVEKRYKFFSFRRCDDNILIVFLLNIKIYTKEI